MDSETQNSSQNHTLLSGNVLIIKFIHDPSYSPFLTSLNDHVRATTNWKVQSISCVIAFLPHRSIWLTFPHIALKNNFFDTPMHAWCKMKCAATAITTTNYLPWNTVFFCSMVHLIRSKFSYF